MTFAEPWIARLPRASVLFVMGVLASALIALPRPSQAADILIFAAASQRDALDAVIDTYRPSGTYRIRASYQSSSALARQIERGAPADLFISANVDWMDYLQTRGLIDDRSRTDLFGNELVLITAKGSKTAGVTVERGFGLAALLGNRRLAVGDPDHVPAGLYARQAMQSLGIWDSVAQKLARADNARSALALVARGETPVGIVYASDAAADSSVRVIGRFPEDAHAPIVYPAAVTERSENANAARAFLDFLRKPEAARIFARYGFRVLGSALN